jgi:biopolymer transport protein ExbB
MECGLKIYRNIIVGLPAILSPLTATAADAGAALHLSVGGMFAQADWLVKTVMLILIAASVATLGIALRKAWELTAQRRSMASALERLEQAESLEAISVVSDPTVAAMARIALRELARQGATPTTAAAEAAKERVAALLRTVEAAQQRVLSRGISVLGSIGAAAPFIGLFGTVWGIMNSFIGIARTQTTSLAVVAPGIAEALLATAFGLIAAVPAVLAYNAITRAIGGYRLRMNHAAVQVMCLLSRQLEPAATGAANRGV